MQEIRKTLQRHRDSEEMADEEGKLADRHGQTQSTVFLNIVK